MFQNDVSSDEELFPLSPILFDDDTEEEVSNGDNTPTQDSSVNDAPVSLNEDRVERGSQSQTIDIVSELVDLLIKNSQRSDDAFDSQEWSINNLRTAPAQSPRRNPDQSLSDSLNDVFLWSQSLSSAKEVLKTSIDGREKNDERTLTDFLIARSQMTATSMNEPYHSAAVASKMASEVVSTEGGVDILINLDFVFDWAFGSEGILKQLSLVKIRNKFRLLLSQNQSVAFPSQHGVLELSSSGMCLEPVLQNLHVSLMGKIQQYLTKGGPSVVHQALVGADSSGTLATCSDGPVSFESACPVDAFKLLSFLDECLNELGFPMKLSLVSSETACCVKEISSVVSDNNQKAIGCFDATQVAASQLMSRSQFLKPRKFAITEEAQVPPVGLSQFCGTSEPFVTNVNASESQAEVKPMENAEVSTVDEDMVSADNQLSAGDFFGIPLDALMHSSQETVSESLNEILFAMGANSSTSDVTTSMEDEFLLFANLDVAVVETSHGFETVLFSSDDPIQEASDDEEIFNCLDDSFASWHSVDSLAEDDFNDSEIERMCIEESLLMCHEGDRSQNMEHEADSANELGLESLGSSHTSAEHFDFALVPLYYSGTQEESVSPYFSSTQQGQNTAEVQQWAGEFGSLCDLFKNALKYRATSDLVHIEKNLSVVCELITSGLCTTNLRTERKLYKMVSDALFETGADDQETGSASPVCNSGCERFLKNSSASTSKRVSKSVKVIVITGKKKRRSHFKLASRLNLLKIAILNSSRKRAAERVNRERELASSSEVKDAVPSTSRQSESLVQCEPGPSTSKPSKATEAEVSKDFPARQLFFLDNISTPLPPSSDFNHERSSTVLQREPFELNPMDFINFDDFGSELKNRISSLLEEDESVLDFWNRNTLPKLDRDVTMKRIEAMTRPVPPLGNSFLLHSCAWSEVISAHFLGIFDSQACEAKESGADEGLGSSLKLTKRDSSKVGNVSMAGEQESFSSKLKRKSSLDANQEIDVSDLGYVTPVKKRSFGQQFNPSSSSTSSVQPTDPYVTQSDHQGSYTSHVIFIFLDIRRSKTQLFCFSILNCTTNFMFLMCIFLELERSF